MKRYSLYILILLTLVSCSKSSDVKSISVIGDLKSEFDITTFYNDNSNSFSRMAYKDTKINAIDASLFYQALDKVYADNTVYFISEDGFMNAIEAESLSETYLGYNEQYGWVFHSDKHPPNSGIKSIKHVLLVRNSDEVDYDFGFNVVDASKDSNHFFSIGELYLKPYRQFSYLDGVSTKVTDGKTYEVPGMKLKKVLSVEDLVDNAYDLSLIMTVEGDYEYLTSQGFIELNGISLNYILPETYDIFNGLKGIMINPPNTTVMDTHDEVIAHLDDKVMVIFIDGFSYTQYKYMKNSMDTYMNRLASEKANTIYKPVTNAGFAAMITGQSPKVNGVLDRSYRTLLSADFFETAEQKGYKSVLIEGDINILDTFVKPILNLDKNNNGITDDEIYDSAVEALSGDYDLMMVHFHSVDEFGHDYGPLHENTISQLELIDNYVESLMEKWSGHVIIIADHGMHQEGTVGNHGAFRYEDLLVPYMRRTNE